MQASRPRNMHTAAAIKQAKYTPTVTLPVAYPCGTSARCIPLRHIIARAKSHSGMQTHGVYRDAPTCPTGPTGPTGQTQASRPRNMHTAAAIKLPCASLLAAAQPRKGRSNVATATQLFFAKLFFLPKKKRRRSRSVRRCSQRLCRRVRSRWRGWSRRDVPWPI